MIRGIWVLKFGGAMVSVDGVCTTEGSVAFLTLVFLPSLRVVCACMVS
jgi:hypothetical protein